MARKSRTGVLKRQREAKKAERAALKRDRKDHREEPADSSNPSRVATADDLAGYGFVDPSETDDSDSQPPLPAATWPTNL